MIFFYQGAYVLCRLFKKTELKQDEIGESSIINEAEEIITSPAEVRFSAEDELSESLSPSLCGTAELQPSSVESHQTLGSEKAAVVTPINFDWQSLSCIADEMEDNVLDTKSIPVSHIISYSIFCQFFFLLYSLYIYLLIFISSFIQPNPELEKLLAEFCPHAQQTADYKMFSPLHSQMQSELGNPYLYNSLTGDINNNQQVIPFQYGTNATDDIENFLSSVFIEPEEQTLASIYDDGKYINMLSLVKDSNSCSESEGEVSQKQVLKLFHCFPYVNK